MFMTGWFPFKYGLGSSMQDNNSIGQDGKCVQQAIEIYYMTVSRLAEPRSRYRVVEGQ